jgi:hypothetical protein
LLFHDLAVDRVWSDEDEVDSVRVGEGGRGESLGNIVNFLFPYRVIWSVRAGLPVTSR